MAIALVLALVSCAAETAPGQACANDDACGPGFDCVDGACVTICRSDSECAAGETCKRFHCTSDQPLRGVRQAPDAPPPSPTPEPGASPSQGTTPPGTVPVPGPPGAPAAPSPDATNAELRALRREVEAIRRQQEEILQLLRKHD